MSKALQPVCKTLRPWLKANLGARCLAPLTGQDAKALDAIAQIIELYAYDRDPAVEQAFALIVRQMQMSCWPLAYHAIAHVMEWGDRERLWSLAGLPIHSFGLCAFEPGGSARG